MRDNYRKNFTYYIILSFFILFILLYSYNISLSNDKIIYNNDDNITYTAYFKINGSTYLEKEKLTCNLVDGQCLITMPLARRENGEVLGYHNNKDAHEVLYNINDQVNLTGDVTFYVISKADLQFRIIDDDINYLTNKISNCTIYNQEDSCSIKLPFYNKEGYEIRGYSTNRDSLTGFIFPNSEYEINRDMVLYPIYGTLTRGRVIDVKNSIIINNMAIDIENGCNQEVYNNYLAYFNIISIKAPYLSVGSKITFLNDETFDNIWGSSYVGMNYGPKNLRLIDVRCSNNIANNYYATIVHEMAHTWDFYYGNFFDKDISEQNDIINLFNKYKDMNNRPFRVYSYTNIREFFADMVRYYYLKYSDPINGYKNVAYPGDIKKVLEKYICIANNNYKEGSC